MPAMTKDEFDAYLKSGKTTPVWTKTGSWSQFKVHAKKIEEATAYLQECQGTSPSGQRKWTPLYRGHRNSSWKVQSTFDRTDNKLTLSEYHDLVLKAQQEYKQLLRAATLDAKEIDNYPYDNSSALKISKILADSNEINILPEELRFWVFLRHYGFPSPLLDWTKDYQVAAFFAFQNKSDEEFISIHTMIPALCGSTGANLITINDSSMQTDAAASLKPLIRRHAEQKSVYTLFYKERSDGRGSKPQSFEKHEDMFKENSAHGGSWGLYFKFNILASERERVLKELDQIGINSAKILANTDARLETIQNRLFLF
ncbi:MAG: FRG domain-containing protein [Elusimicrobiota bacterium]